MSSERAIALELVVMLVEIKNQVKSIFEIDM
jgi:hypothetical protein